jgi:hypothetical protein
MNVVPVDAVIRDCLNLETADFPVNPIIHSTSVGGPTICEAADVASEILGLPPLRIGMPDGKPSQTERWLGNQLRFYRPYVHFTGQFARSLPNPPSLEVHDLRSLVTNFARSNVPLREQRIASASPAPAAVLDAVPDTDARDSGLRDRCELPS